MRAYLPARVTRAGLGAAELVAPGGGAARAALIEHLEGAGERLRAVPLAERIAAVRSAAAAARFAFRAETSRDRDLFAGLTAALGAHQLAQAIAFSACLTGADTALFEARSALEYPPLGVFVHPRNADVLTEWALHLAAGLPVLVKGSAMSIALAEALADTALGDAVAVIDWESGSPGDRFYEALPAGSLAVLFGGIAGVAAVRAALPAGTILRDRSHRSSIGWLGSPEEAWGMAAALAFTDGDACFSPVTIFCDDPVAALDVCFRGLVAAARSRPLAVSAEENERRVAFGNTRCLLDGDYRVSPTAGALYALASDEVRVIPPGHRGAIFLRAGRDAGGWAAIFGRMDEELHALARDGLTGRGCGQHALDKSDVERRHAAVDAFFANGPPYRWLQTLAHGGDPPAALVEAFIRAGGRRIVAAGALVPPGCVPPDGEAPIALEAGGGRIRWALAPDRLCLRDDRRIVGRRFEPLSTPIFIDDMRPSPAAGPPRGAWPEPTEEDRPMSNSAPELSSRWFFREQWGFRAAPPPTDYELYGKALLHCAAADGRLAPEELTWVLGYMTAAGATPETIELLSHYEAKGEIDDELKASFVVRMAARGLVYDAIRACAADGELHERERAAITRTAAALSVPAEVVTQLEAAHRSERHAMATRLALIYPGGLPF